MRPTKLTEKVIETLRLVIDEDHNALVCTDEELLFLTNELLEPEERISYRTFQRYKHLAKAHIDPQDYHEYLHDENCTPEKLELYQALHSQLTRNNIKVKNQCMKEIQAAEKGWEKYRWILQLRLRHWNGLRNAAPLSAREEKLNAPSKVFKSSFRFDRYEGDDLPMAAEQ